MISAGLERSDFGGKTGSIVLPGHEGTIKVTFMVAASDVDRTFLSLQLVCANTTGGVADDNTETKQAPAYKPEE